MSEPLKHCSKCGKDLPATLEYFYCDKSAKDGFLYKCKKCTSKKKVIPQIEGHKFCKNCQQYLPATSGYFHKDAEKSDGFCTTCKKCKRDSVRVYVASNPKKVKESSKRTRERYADKYKEDRKAWVEKNREYVRAKLKQHYEDNKERILKQMHEHYLKNRDRKLKYAKQYASKNQDKIAAYREKNREHQKVVSRTWKKANAIKRRTAEARRRARKAAAPGNHTAEDLDRIYKAQRGRCYYCGCKLGAKYHFDHVIPLSRGGSNGPENLVAACPPCNVSKGDKLPHEWIRGGRLL